MIKTQRLLGSWVQHAQTCRLASVRVLSTQSRFISTGRKARGTTARADDARPVEPSSGKERRFVNHILTLNPDKFVSVGQQKVRAGKSGNLMMRVGTHPLKIRLSYPGGPNSSFFPPESSGLLYCQKPLPSQPALSGSLRLRLLTSGIDQFAQGRDFEYPDGTPWRVPLYTIIKFKSYKTILAMLLEEGMVTQELVDQVERLPYLRVYWTTNALHELSQPFISDLRSSPEKILIIKPNTLVAWKHFAHSAFKVGNRKNETYFPFKGSIRCRLEKSPLPEHIGTYNVVLRVLEILEPIECVVPNYQYNLALPVAGELLSRRRLGKTDYHPWTYDLGQRCTNPESLFVEDVVDT